MAKQPTPYQIKSQLAYSSTTPAFLQRMKNQMAGRSGDDDGGVDEDYDSWEPGTSSGHRRASPPRRPDNDPGSADEDDDDERPQVVVLKEGKHLTALEAENERRKQKGLPPLADPGQLKPDKKTQGNEPEVKEKSDTKKSQQHSLSFSSTGSSSSSAKKRKLASDVEEPETKGGAGDTKKTKKKAKAKAKQGKTLLSFGDGEV